MSNIDVLFHKWCSHVNAGLFVVQSRSVCLRCKQYTIEKGSLCSMLWRSMAYTEFFSLASSTSLALASRPSVFFCNIWSVGFFWYIIRIVCITCIALVDSRFMWVLIYLILDYITKLLLSEVYFFIVVASLFIYFIHLIYWVLLVVVVTTLPGILLFPFNKTRSIGWFGYKCMTIFFCFIV